MNYPRNTPTEPVATLAEAVEWLMDNRPTKRFELRCASVHGGELKLLMRLHGQLPSERQTLPNITPEPWRYRMVIDSPWGRRGFTSIDCPADDDLRRCFAFLVRWQDKKADLKRDYDETLEDAEALTRTFSAPEAVRFNRLVVARLKHAAWRPRFASCATREVVEEAVPFSVATRKKLMVIRDLVRRWHDLEMQAEIALEALQ